MKKCRIMSAMLCGVLLLSSVLPLHGSAAKREDFSTERSILMFLAGDWYFLDPESGEDYAVIRFEADGDCSFRRLSQEETSEGKLSLSWRQAKPDKDAPDNFRISMEDIPDEYLPKSERGGYAYSAVSGLYRFGRGKGEDYLYLSELMYGDSLIARYLFSPDPSEDPEAGDFTNDWLLHRKNNVKRDLSPEGTESFFAFLWKREEDGSLLMQRLIPEEYEDYESFTNRHFVAAYFRPDGDIAIERCETAEDLDTSRFLEESVFESSYPLEVYGVVTDEEGRICGISETFTSYFGVYDMGELEPEFSYEGTDLIYNDSTYPLPEYDGLPTDAIMGCTQVGNYIVVEGHINPHISSYHLFNIDTGNFENVLFGSCLTWYDEDITTLVCSQWGEIYDYRGDVIGRVDGIEISDLSYARKGRYLDVTYWTTENGEQKEAQERIAVPERTDAGMFRLAEFLRRRTPERWESFLEEAPEDALALVTVNAPQEFTELVYDEVDLLEGGPSDEVTVTALQDGTKVRVDSGEVVFGDEDTFTWEKEEEGDTYLLQKGETLRFLMTVPEGVPVNRMSIRTDEAEAEWLVSAISGERDIRSTFVQAEKEPGAE